MDGHTKIFWLVNNRIIKVFEPFAKVPFHSNSVFFSRLYPRNISYIPGIYFFHMP